MADRDTPEMTIYVVKKAIILPGNQGNKTHTHTHTDSIYEYLILTVDSNTKYFLLLDSRAQRKQFFPFLWLH
jgi:hypothetical protein